MRGGQDGLSIRCSGAGRGMEGGEVLELRVSGCGQQVAQGEAHQDENDGDFDGLAVAPWQEP